MLQINDVLGGYICSKPGRRYGSPAPCSTQTVCSLVAWSTWNKHPTGHPSCVVLRIRERFTMQIITIRLIPLQLNDDFDELTDDLLMTLQATKTIKIIQSFLQPGSFLPKAYTTWNTSHPPHYTLNPKCVGRLLGCIEQPTK